MHEGVDEPERAEQEGTLIARQSVRRVVAVAVPTGTQVALDDIDRCEDPRVGRRQEPERGDQERSGIDKG